MLRESDRGPRQLLAACIASFCFYLGSYILTPMIPLYAAHIGATTVEVGYITASIMVVSAVTAMPFGLSSDRLGRKKLTIFGASLSSASSLLLVVTRNPLQLLLVYALGGLGRAAYMPVMAAFVGDIAHSSKTGQAFGWYSASMLMGMASGSSVGGVVAGFLGYQNMFICSGICFLSTVVTAASIKIPPSNLDTTKTSENSRKSAESGLRALGSNPTVWACWSANFCLFFGYSVSTSFFQLYFRRLGMVLSVIGLFYTLTNVSNAISRLSVGNISDRLGKRAPFLIAGLAFVALATAVLPSITSFTIIAALMVLHGSGTGMANLSANILITEATDLSTRGLAMGVLQTCLYSGLAVGATLLGGVVESQGLQTASFIGAAMIAAGAMMTSSLIYIAKRSQHE